MSRYFRFEDHAAQDAFIRELERSATPYARADDGAVMFGDIDAVAVMKAVNRARDAQFSWYLLKWNTEEESDRYRDVLKAVGLPFIVERQETGTWFLVRREDRSQHDELWTRALEKKGDASAP